ncbi:MAG: IPExxxVDY family protein [Chitinophagaceae bacterium]|jgi:hypothetical protein|uniref:IPExxxVDY family protein n=1 Tax=unclassified Paraflavitalea TaxID=2798305 RepID=UPI003D337952|nr:IPExxxVDY family protein [Chitinophagaceae bacterium]
MKLKIDLDEMEKEFFEDTLILGVVAPVDDYKICWQLNQLLSYDFRRNADLEVQLRRKQRDYYFSIFEYPMPNSSLVHYVYCNQNDGEYLLPEMKHLDFIWLMKGDVVSSDYLEDLTKTLRSIPAVQLVVEVSPVKIKSKSNLIF